MELLGMILFMTGLVTFILGHLCFLVAAFKENVLWGLGCLLISPVSFFFLIVHWAEAKKPFGISCLGIVLIVLAVIASPEAAETLPN